MRSFVACCCLSAVAALTTGSLVSCGSDSTTVEDFQPPADASTDSSLPDAQPDAQPDSSPDASADADLPDTPQPDAPVPDAEVPDSPNDASPQDAAEPWPTCDSQPEGVPDRTLTEIWTEDPAAATAVWVTGLYVTAISKGACTSGSACQVFLQDAETYASFDAGAHHAMKLFVSGSTAQYFTSLHVGDRVNVYAHAWRYDVNPSQRELLLQVNSQLRGCAKAVGTGQPQPIADVELADLTVDAYENTHGPLLVRVEGVTGKPGNPSETFALWKTGGPYVDAGIESVVSASPYFLPSGAFSGLPTTGTTAVDFESITGVFGLFVPPGDAGSGPKYLMLYGRSMDDLIVLP